MSIFFGILFVSAKICFRIMYPYGQVPSDELPKYQRSNILNLIQ